MKNLLPLLFILLFIVSCTKEPIEDNNNYIKCGEIINMIPDRDCERGYIVFFIIEDILVDECIDEDYYNSLEIGGEFCTVSH